MTGAQEQQQQQKQQQDSSDSGRGHDGKKDEHRHSTGQESDRRQRKWTRPQTAGPVVPSGEWTDPYTKRRVSSRAYSRVSQEELDGILQRLRQPTVSSTGAEGLRDKEFVYTQPRHTKTNPRIDRKKPEPRSAEERDAIAQRLFSAKTRAWIARREKNPNTRVHYSPDFTII